MPIQHESKKHGKKHGFGVTCVCTKDHDDQRPECALLCFEQCIVEISLSCSTLLPYEHTPNSTVSVLFKALCTLDLKPSGAARWSNYAQNRTLCTKNCFPVTDVWIVQNVHNSVVCMKHVQSGSFCCTIVSPFIHHRSLAEKKEEKTP